MLSFPSFLKTISTGCRILGWQLFYWSILNMSAFAIGFYSTCWKVSLLLFQRKKCAFFAWYFKILFVPVHVHVYVHILCLSYLGFMGLFELCTDSLIRFENSQPLFIHMLLLPYSFPFSFWLHVCETFDHVTYISYALHCFHSFFILFLSELQF